MFHMMPFALYVLKMVKLKDNEASGSYFIICCKFSDIFVYAGKHFQVVPETLEPSLQLAAAVLAQVIVLLCLVILHITIPLKTESMKFGTYLISNVLRIIVLRDLVLS